VDHPVSLDEQERLMPGGSKMSSQVAQCQHNSLRLWACLDQTNYLGWNHNTGPTTPPLTSTSTS
jgi:hypothetical protein